jgi:hypothetical protein
MDEPRQVANRLPAALALSEPPGAIEFRNRWEMPMAARKKKSGSKKSAAKKKAPKTRKSRVAPKKKAAKAPKRKVAAKKAVRARSKPVAAKKRPMAAPKAAVARPRPAAAPAAVPPPAPAPAPVPTPVAELDNRIAIVRANLRELVEQAASSAGAANEELLSQRIAEQEERLRRLRQERDALDC